MGQELFILLLIIISLYEHLDILFFLILLMNIHVIFISWMLGIRMYLDIFLWAYVSTSLQ